MPTDRPASGEPLALVSAPSLAQLRRAHPPPDEPQDEDGHYDVVQRAEDRDELRDQVHRVHEP